MKFGHYLRRKRLEVGLTQKYVAKALGYNSSQYVSNWERDLCHPSLKALKKLIVLYKLEDKEVIDIYLSEKRKVIVKTFRHVTL